MKSTAILDLMIKDHKRLFKYLKDVENNLKSDFEVLLKSFNTFEWNLEKHFFVEERAVFTSYNPDFIEDGHQLFTTLSKQHTKILEKVETLRKRLRSGRSIEISDLEDMLLKHKTYEEKYVYPVLDVEISEGEKRYMIERINDINI
jgi:iron-sulfur cluster repair protein YtfE (RIC family)